MRRTRRVVIVISAVVLVGIVAVILRALDGMGVFTEITNVACEDPVRVRGVTGAGDMQYDAPSNTLFIAATDARSSPSHPSATDGIYAYHPGQPAGPFKIPGTSVNFHPRAMSLFRSADGSLTLMAVNQPAVGAPMVDIFDVSDPATANAALHERESIGGDMLMNPGGIVAVGKGQFYATNTQTSGTALGEAIEFHLMLPRANIVYFDGAQFRVAADGLLAASGVGRSPDGSHIYVDETTGRELRTYERAPFSGELKLISELPVNSGIGGVSVTGNGEIYVAGQPKLFAFIAYQRNAREPAPSQVFQLAVDRNGIPKLAKLIYSGTEIGAASIAVAVRDRLLIGSELEASILSCALPR